MTDPRIFFFGDLTETDFGVEELLGHAEKSKRLEDYFNDALVVTQKTLNSINLKDHDLSSRDSLIQLAVRAQKDDSSSVVLRAWAICFAQIGHLIAYVHRTPTRRRLKPEQMLKRKTAI